MTRSWPDDGHLATTACMTATARGPAAPDPASPTEPFLNADAARMVRIRLAIGQERPLPQVGCRLKRTVVASARRASLQPAGWGQADDLAPSSAPVRSRPAIADPAECLLDLVDLRLDERARRFAEYFNRKIPLLCATNVIMIRPGGGDPRDGGSIPAAGPRPMMLRSGQVRMDHTITRTAGSRRTSKGIRLRVPSRVRGLPPPPG